MSVDVDFRLYGLQDILSTQNINDDDTDTFKAYILIQNPLDKQDYEAAKTDAVPNPEVYYNGWLNSAFDGV